MADITVTCTNDKNVSIAFRWDWDNNPFHLLGLDGIYGYDCNVTTSENTTTDGSTYHEAFCQVLFRVIDATYALFSTIKPHAVIHGAVGLWLKWRSGKVARYLGFATWILPVHFFRA